MVMSWYDYDIIAQLKQEPTDAKVANAKLRRQAEKQERAIQFLYNYSERMTFRRTAPVSTNETCVTSATRMPFWLRRTTVSSWRIVSYWNASIRSGCPTRRYWTPPILHAIIIFRRKTSRDGGRSQPIRKHEIHCLKHHLHDAPAGSSSCRQYRPKLGRASSSWTSSPFFHAVRRP